jgi:putative FmdB family regulatory protein
VIYDYECKKCSKVQEKYHKMAEKNTEPCTECGATAENLTKLLSPQKTKHVSWSLWNVNANSK